MLRTNALGMDLALQAWAVDPSLRYRPRRPEQAVLYTIVRDHYETSERRPQGGVTGTASRGLWSGHSKTS